MDAGQGSDCTVVPAIEPDWSPLGAFPLASVNRLGMQLDMQLETPHWKILELTTPGWRF